jgi:hypothetical protein
LRGAAEEKTKMAETDDKPFRNRRWYQFSLRTLLVFTAIVAVVCAFVGWIAEAQRRTRASYEEARILTEIAVLDAGFKRYKAEYGEYPPSDFSHLDDPKSPQYIELAHHLMRTFPRADPATEIAAVRALGVRTPAQAVCFWLGGFATDSTHPVSALVNNSKARREPPLYEFDRDRLRLLDPTDQVPVYVPRSGVIAPYVYFAAKSYATQDPFHAEQWKDAGTGTAGAVFVRRGRGTVREPEFVPDHLRRPRRRLRRRRRLISVRQRLRARRLRQPHELQLPNFGRLDPKVSETLASSSAL